MFRRRFDAMLAAICACYLGVVLFLIWNRAPTWDEGWFASPSYNLVHHGHFGTSTLDPQGYLLRPPLTHIDKITYWVLPLSLFAQTAWYAIFGFGLAQMRLMTALFGVLGIIALYRWMIHLTEDRLAACIAALLMAQDNILIWRSADGRMDVMCMSLGLMGQASYLAWRGKSLKRATLLAGVFACLSGLTHPNGLIPLLCMIATALVLDAGRLRFAHFVLFAAPFLIGGALFALWATRDPVAFRAQILGNQAGERMGSLSHPLRAISEDIDRYKYVFYGSQYEAGRFAPLKLVLLVTWFGGLGGRIVLQGLKSRVSIVLALCGVIPVVALTFFNVKNAYYLIFIAPFLAANAGALFAHLWRSGLGARRFAAAALALTLLVSAAVTGKRALASRREYVGYLDLSAKAAGMASQGQIIAPASYAFGIGFDRVVQDDNLGFYSGRCPAVIIDAGLTPDEVENLQRGAPAVLEHRKRMLTVHYRAVQSGLYRRLSCPAGTREN